MRAWTATIGLATAVTFPGCGTTPADADNDDSDDATTTSSDDGTETPGLETTHGDTSGAPPTDDSDDDGSTSEGVADTSGPPPSPGCGDGIVDPDEACDDGNDDAFDGCLPDCTAVEPLDVPALEWTYVEIEGTRCLDGTTAGFGISHNPNSPNVMIYLEGGGACFNDACDFTAFSAPFVPPSDGIFARTNEANPVADWTMIYVPYCSGDIHAGRAEAVLGGTMRYFYGFDNITRFMQRWVPSFPQPEQVLLTGISAGGFGAALNAGQVADAYGDEVQIVVVDDSGPPLSNDVIPPCLQEIFRQTWNLDDTVLAACPGCDPNDFATDLFDAVLTEHPNLRFGLFSNTADLVIRTYMGFGWGNGTHDNCGGIPIAVPLLDYNNDLIAMRARHEDTTSTFYVNGLGHTALRAGFETTTVAGVTLASWLADVIAGEHVHVGP